MYMHSLSHKISANAQKTQLQRQVF